MNVLDIIIVTVLALASYIGYKKPLRYLSAIIGLIIGTCVAALAYRQLVFLTEQSGIRVTVLVLLVMSLGFLSFDLCQSLVKKAQVQFGRQPRTSLLFRVISIFAGIFGLLIFIWLAAGILSGSQVALIQHQIARSAVISRLNTVSEPPSPFRQIAHLLGPFSSPRVFIGQEPAFDDTVAVTTEFSALDSATQKAKSSVVKVSAWGCGSAAVGSGFVVDGALIITNAHVIAGAERIIVQETNVALSAQPVLFNPSLDIAILSTTPAPVTTILSLYDQQASPGAITSIIGYPGGGNLTTSDGIILSTINALGYDIYGQTPITRQIYAFRGRIVPGNSGGPLINTSGKVVGLIFGNSTTRPNTGFALPSTQIQNALKTIAAKTTPVSTGNCTSR